MINQVAPSIDFSPKDTVQSTNSLPNIEQNIKTTDKQVQTDTVTISTNAIKMNSGIKNSEWVRIPPWTIKTKKT